MNSIIKFSYMLVLTCICYSCKKSNIDTYKSLDEFYNSNYKKSESFTLNASIGGTITGQEGTIITFRPNCIFDSLSHPVSGNVQIKLFEFYSLKDMFFSNISTIIPTYPAMLVTGGSLYVEITQNNQLLNLSYYDSTKATYNSTIPIGLKGTLVAVSADGNLKFGSKEIEVTGNDLFEVNLQEGTTAKLSQLLDTF